MQDRTPPNSKSYEMIVLGSILLEPHCLHYLDEAFNPDFFYETQHRLVADAISKLIEKNEKIDILTVWEQLKKSKKSKKITDGPVKISRLTEHVGSTVNFETHYLKLKEFHLKRQLVNNTLIWNNQLHDESVEILDLFDQINHEILNLSGAVFKKTATSVKDDQKTYMKWVKDSRENPKLAEGVKVGFEKLDSITNGFQKSDAIFIGARPGMGKTALALNMASYAAENESPAAFFSLEMSKFQIISRLNASLSGIPFKKHKNPSLLSDNDYDLLLNDTSTRIQNMDLHIDDTSALSVLEFKAKLRRLIADKGVKIAFIDYIQLMTSPLQGQGLVASMTNIANGLKATAKDLDIPIVILSQLNRALESRSDSKKIPMLSDLRESGAIEQNADLVLFPFRPEYYGIMEDEEGLSTQGKADLVLAKNRHGELGTIKIDFDGPTVTFSDPDSSYDPNQFPDSTFEEEDEDQPFVIDDTE